MKKYGFIGRLVVYLSTGAMMQVASLLLTPLIASHLSTVELGTMAVLLAIESILIVLMDFSFTTALSRLFFDSESSKDHRVIISSIFLVSTVIATLVGGLAIYILYLHWDKVLSIPSPSFATITFVVASAYMSRINTFFQQIHRNLGDAASFGKLSLLRTLTFTVATLAAIFLYPIGLAGIFLARLLGTASSGIIELLQLIRHVKRSDINYFRELRGIWSFTVPLVPQKLSISLRQGGGDRLVLSQFLSAESIGIYYAAGFIQRGMGLITLSFEQAFDNWYYRGKRVELGVGTFAAKQFAVKNTYLIILYIISIFLAVTGPEILALVLPARLSDAFPSSALFITAQFIFAANQLCTKTLIFHKKTLYISINTMLATAVMLIMTGVLVNMFGIPGGALAMVSGNATLLFLTNFSINKLEKPDTDFVLISKLTAALFGYSLFAYYYTSPFQKDSILIRSVLAIAASSLVLIAAGPNRLVKDARSAIAQVTVKRRPPQC